MGGGGRWWMYQRGGVGGGGSCGGLGAWGWCVHRGGGGRMEDLHLI